MDVYLIRHGEAVARGENGSTDDADRALTDRGREQTRALARALQAHGVHVDEVVTSPLVRARQTAEELAQALGLPGDKLAECPDLGPGGKPRKLTRFLRGLNAGSVAIVGHQPDLGQYAAWLIGSKKAQVELSKSGAAFVHCESGLGKGEAQLIWLVTPEWFAPAGEAAAAGAGEGQQ